MSGRYPMLDEFVVRGVVYLTRPDGRRGSRHCTHWHRRDATAQRCATKLLRTLRQSQ